MESTLITAASGVRMKTTQALRRLAERRDPEAWAAILEQHGAGILSLARQITGDAALCEDVCQETLLQIRAHAGQFTPPAPPQDAELSARGWIMRIASCTAFRMLRTRQRSEKRELSAAQQRQQAPSAQDVALAREQHERIKREVAGMPEFLREPLSLHYFGMMQYAELGAALGCSQEAAKKRVQRGVALLRTRLAACGVALSIGSLAATLGTSLAQASEAGIAAQTALDAQHLAAWQGLLNSTCAPTFTGVVTLGGMTLMTKYAFGAVAVLLFGFSTIEALQIHNLKTQIAEAQAAAKEAGASVAALEKKAQAAESAVAVMKQQLSVRSDEVTQMHDQLAELKKQHEAAGSRNFVWGGAPGQPLAINVPPGGNGVTITAPELNLQEMKQKNIKATVNGKPIEFNIPVPPGVIGGEAVQGHIQNQLDTALKDLKDANGAIIKDVLIPNGNMRVMVLTDGPDKADPNKPADAKGKAVKPPAPPAVEPNENGNF